MIVDHQTTTGLLVPSKLTDLPVPAIVDLLSSTDPLYALLVMLLHGPAAMFLLHAYRCTVRFVDDFTSGPNPFTKQLLYCQLADPNAPLQDYTVMGGLIKGIYPGQYLELEPTPGDSLYCFNTLDVQIVTKVHTIVNEHGVLEKVVKSYTLLYDKRRNACYWGIPIVQYTHVSSTLPLHSGYNILVGQLHRFRELITWRDNYVLECGRLIRRMQMRGYGKTILFRKLKHHLRIYPDTFGDSSFQSLFDEITECYNTLCGEPDWEFTCPGWDYAESPDSSIDDLTDDWIELEELVEL